MLLALGAGAIVVAVLAWELAFEHLRVPLTRAGRAFVGARALGRERRRVARETIYDPGRERRAEQRARELLRSCVNEEEWAMYRDLGFLRVWSPSSWSSPWPRADRVDRAVDAESAQGEDTPTEPRAHTREGAPYAYLLYPHRPIVAYIPQTGALLNEYCVAFPDETRPYGSARLPDADDVLAKWMALTADERRLIADANMHLPGRQVDPEQVREDLARLARWERERAERSFSATRAA
jgi:hypothetical protein